MRTIAATFDTREEAETASRRLQSIGVPAEGILLRDLSVSEAGETSAAPGGADEARGIFISAKVSPEQVGAATEILKGGGARDAARADAAGPESPRQERVAASAPAGAGLASPPVAQPAADRVDAPLGREPQKPVAHHIPAPDGEWRRWSRRMVIFCLVLVVAFVAGAMLGFVV